MVRQAARIFYAGLKRPAAWSLGSDHAAPLNGVARQGSPWSKPAGAGCVPLPPLDAPACGNPERISAKGLAPLGPEDATRTERTGHLRSVIQELIEPVQRHRFKSQFVPQCFEILAVSGDRRDELFLDHCGQQGSVLPQATRPDAAS